ncbi:44_t:CDS:2, partial [Entrophospora sp. SA101]
NTAKILRDEIEHVLSRIGPNKFAAVMSDNASAILSARKQISEIYPFILNTNFGALLRKYIDEYGIKGGGLCLYTPTRWTSMFETTNPIYERHKDLLTNDKVKHILGLRGFFHDVGLVTSVLLPLQKAILNLEGTNVNLADCFIQLVKLAVNINKISPEHGLIEFRNHCIKVINNRWESFEIHPYLLAYFLHPLYHGVGLKSTIWPNLTKYAGEIFWNMNKKNHSNNKVAELIGQMANFKCSEGVFSIQYSSSYTRPRTWWQVIDDSNEYVKSLAIKIFSITAYMAKIRYYLYSNIKNELNYESKERSEEELISLVQGRLEIPNEDVYVLIINEMVDLNNPIFNEDYDDLNDNIEVEDENMEESSEEVFDFDAIPEISPPSN